VNNTIAYQILMSHVFAVSLALYFPPTVYSRHLLLAARVPQRYKPSCARLYIVICPLPAFLETPAQTPATKHVHMSLLQFLEKVSTLQYRHGGYLLRFPRRHEQLWQQ